MKQKILFVAVLMSLLLVVPVLAARPASSTAVSGLYGAYWKDSFFGSPVATWPGCTEELTPPAGTPSSTPPSATEIDPNINFGSTTGFYWVESSPAVNPATAAGDPGGFAVTPGGYGTALSSWGDNLATLESLASSSGGAYFVNTGFSAEWTGYIYLTAGVTYYFQTDSDDGSWLYINTTPGSSTISAANLVIDNGGVHAHAAVDSGPVSVSTTGNYPIEVDYYETCDSQSGIDLSWSTGPSSGYTIIPSSVFTPALIGSNAPTVVSPVPEFPFGIALLLGLAVPAMLLLRKKFSPAGIE
jgi:PA14 domain